MPTRDDYLLRFVDLLRQAIAESIKLREKGRPDQAMFALMVAQEKLFARPLAEFAPLPLEEQLRLLTLNEPAPTAREKVLGYARLLREAAFNYGARDRSDLAESTFQLALTVGLHGALDYIDEGASAVVQPSVLSADAIEFLRDLLGRIPPQKLHAPVVEMLKRVQLT